MKTLLILTLTLFSLCLFSQTNKLNKIKVAKLKADSVNIVGRWVRLYDLNGKNKKTIPKQIDTITFLSNYKYYRIYSPSRESGDWKLTDSVSKTSYAYKFSNAKVIIKNWRFISIIDGVPINILEPVYDLNVKIKTPDILTITFLTGDGYYAEDGSSTEIRHYKRVN